MKNVWTVAIICLLGTFDFGCEPKKLKGGAERSTAETEQGDKSTPLTQKADSAKDEKVDPPQNIIGHYLHCGIEQEPTDAKAEALVGCRFDSSTGQRVPARTLGSAYHFGLGILADPRLTVYIKDLAADNRYDAAYLFVGPDRQSVLAGARATLIKVQIVQSRATGTSIVVGTRLSAAEQSVTSFPEPRTTDYAQVRDTILTEAMKSQSTAPLPPVQ